jgi:methionine-rich copper-binding protein CopC
MSVLFRLATVAAVVLAALILGLGSASAHTELATSEPREGQSLTTAPRQITLTFIDSVQPVSAQVSVRGSDGRSVTTGPATVTDAVVHQPVDITTDGSYLVAYRVVSQDGHPVTGELTFSYAAASSDTSSPAADESLEGPSPTTSAEAPVAEESLAQSTEPDGAVSTALWWLLGASVAVVVVLAVLAVRRRSSGG